VNRQNGPALPNKQRHVVRVADNVVYLALVKCGEDRVPKYFRRTRPGESRAHNPCRNVARERSAHVGEQLGDAERLRSQKISDVELVDYCGSYDL